MYARNYTNYSDEQFRDIVSIQVWHHSLVKDVNFLAGDFCWKLDNCAECLAPVEKLKPKQVKLRLKPWISTDLQKLMKVRDNLFARKNVNLITYMYVKYTIRLEIVSLGN